MESPLGGDEFAPVSTYLNTAACGLLPRRAVDAVRRLAEDTAAGNERAGGSLAATAAVRESFARIAGVAADRVALAGSVASLTGLVAASLPSGADVLIPERDFASVVTPLASRPDLKPRYAPLDGLAEAVRPGTALVALSAVQSADGRVADLAAVREAATACGARILLDATQAAGWLPLDAGAYDYTVTSAYKFLLSPRGVSFLTVGEDAQEGLRPLAPGLFAAETRDDMYGALPLASSARRYDEPPSFLAYHAAERSLALVEEIGLPALHAHATGLAARFRTGLVELGHTPVPGDSAIVVVPGLGGAREALAAAGVVVSAPAGGLRAAFHLHNAAADVDRALEALSGVR
ncbi:aminotransferase [Streptomyces solincola]|uniref:Aminotransferase n=1 Tax=Streptomyces solincola TaxID=2100817 RepID=A0A2S9PT74_9ACTN|nr:aminotransferase class V-fold PLP-dependent enzyme [Streptomyces solincola]PRH77615.1 aminotransferase [Streptomyces solincola]